MFDDSRDTQEAAKLSLGLAGVHPQEPAPMRRHQRPTKRHGIGVRQGDDGTDHPAPAKAADQRKALQPSVAFDYRARLATASTADRISGRGTPIAARSSVRISVSSSGHMGRAWPVWSGTAVRMPFCW